MSVGQRCDSFGRQQWHELRILKKNSPSVLAFGRGLRKPLKLVLLVVFFATNVYANSFPFPVPVFPLDTRPLKGIAVDLNGDRIEDLISTPRFGEGFQVFIGSSNGRFSDEHRFATSMYVKKLLGSADFNRDGHEDVVFLESPSFDGSIWYGDGNGAFGASKGFHVAAYAASAHLVHLDDDEYWDILVGDSRRDRVVALRGIDNGFTGVETLVGVETRFTDIKAARINEDEYADIVILGPDRVTVHLSDGKFGYSAPYEIEHSSSITGNLLLGDINADQVVDIVYAGTFDWFWLPGDGQSNFLDPMKFADRRWTAGHLVPSANSLAKDVVISGIEGTVSRFSWDGLDGFLTASLRVSGTEIVIGDFDGNTHEDILALSSRGLTLAMSDANGVVDSQFIEQNGAGVWDYRLRVVDLNADGLLDLQSRNTFFISQGDGEFEELVDVFAGGNISNRFAGDFNSDALPDVLEIFHPGKWRIAIQDSSGNFDYRFSGEFFTTRYFEDGLTGDFDGDGNQDFCVWDDDNDRQLLVMLGDGAGDFEERAVAIERTIFFEPEVANVDRNLGDEIVIGLRYMSFETSQDGGSLHAEIRSIEPPFNDVEGVALEDIDQDESADFIVFSNDHVAYAYGGEESVLEWNIIDLSPDIEPVDVSYSAHKRQFAVLGASETVILGRPLRSNSGFMLKESGRFYAGGVRPFSLDYVDVTGDSLDDIVVVNIGTLVGTSDQGGLNVLVDTWGDIPIFESGFEQ